MEIGRIAAYQIRAVIQDRERNGAAVSVDVETKAPFMIEGIAVDVGDVDREVLY